MANPIATNGTHYRAESYANQIVPLFRKDLVVRSEFSRDYEGNPTLGAVNVPVRETDVALGNYDVSTGLALGQSATTYLNIPIVLNKGINEIVDGYEATVIPDNIKAQRLESAAYTIGLTLELDAIGELEDYGTIEDSTEASSNTTIYKNIKNSIIECSKLGIKKSDMVVIISDDTEGLLLEDDKFSNSAGSLGADLIRSGVVGKIAGVRVKTSSNLSATTEYIVMAKPWCQAIDAWKVEPTFNNLSNTFIGASALQGRMVYADKLTKETACRVKTVAGSI